MKGDIEIMDVHLSPPTRENPAWCHRNCMLFVSSLLPALNTSTGHPKIKVLIKNFNSDLFITLIYSFIISLSSADLHVLFDISFIRFGWL